MLSACMSPSSSATHRISSSCSMRPNHNRRNAMKQTPTPDLEPTDIVSLAEMKRQLRITDNSADEIVADSLCAAVYFVRDAADVTLIQINESKTLQQAVIAVGRHFFHGFEEIPPLSAIWSLINAGAPC